MKNVYLLIFIFIATATLWGSDKSSLSKYDVEWFSQSRNASESMPFGGGDIGCNAWVENNNLMLYIQRSGCFSENGEYLKLGRVRINLTPNPFEGGIKFSQRLDLNNGQIIIKAEDKQHNNVFITLWTDIFTHSIHIDIKSDRRIAYEASYENWRFEDKLLTDDNRGRFGCFGLEGYPGQVIKKKDECSFADNKILFYHHNAEHTLSPEVMIEQQGLTKYAKSITNNISNLTFGGMLFAENSEQLGTSDGVYCGTPFKAWSIKSKSPLKHHHIILATFKEQTADLGLWKNKLDSVCNKVKLSAGNKARNIQWWHDFWKRSYIYISGQDNKDSLMWQMGKNYQLMRYELACNLYGDYPSKFNGGNFTFDPILVDKNMKHDPDWRQWGGDVFTAQNQRLLYWPMLKSGDFDGMKSQFNLYEWGLPGAMAKVKESFNHEGAMYCEYANAPGLDFGAGWGWDKSAKQRVRGEEIPFGDSRANANNTYGELVEHGIMANGAIAYHWESQVENAFMMLEYHRFTGNNIDRYMPFIKQSLLFFDKHYQIREQMRTGKPLDNNGKLVFFPSTSCESYRGATNPTDLISGIRACLDYLTTADDLHLSTEDKDYFSGYLNRLPAINIGTFKGDTIIEPAVSYLKYQNVECPQFYPLFPFNLYDLNSQEMPYFRNAWKYGTFPKNMIISWHQDGIFYARMGMVKEAKEYLEKKLKNSGRRFPTFWGPGHDWTPDHNWGGSAMIGVQEMLLQTNGDKIYLLPSWPKDVDVTFKLHAPHNTVVECVYQNGAIKKLSVTPKYRSKDIIQSH
jgi:hypothetical protein